MLAGGAADSPLRDLPPPAAVQEPQPQLLPGLLWAVHYPGCAVRLRNCSLPLAGSQATEAAGQFEQMGHCAVNNQCVRTNRLVHLPACVELLNHSVPLAKQQRSSRCVSASGVSIQDSGQSVASGHNMQHQVSILANPVSPGVTLGHPGTQTKLTYMHPSLSSMDKPSSLHNKPVSCVEGGTPSVQEASSNGTQAQLSAPVLRRQSSLGQEDAPAWTGRRLAMAASVTLAGGSIAGLLGIGGGMVMGEPLGVLLPVHGPLSWSSTGPKGRALSR